MASATISELPRGAAVRVVEVVVRPDLQRVRGRIDQPQDGWVSLENLRSGYRWVRWVRSLPPAAAAN